MRRSFTLLYDEAGTAGPVRGPLGDHLRRCSASGRGQRNFRALLPLFPTAVRRLDLSGFDCVVSSSSAFAHGVRPAAGRHARLLLPLAVPLRLARARTARSPRCPRRLRPALALAAAPPPRVRPPRAHGRRPATRQRRRSPASGSGASGAATRRSLHPPVEVDRFAIGEPGDHVLFVAELVRHKRPEVAIEAAVAAGRRDQGGRDGPELRAPARALRQPAPSSSAAWTTRELARLYAEAAALVVPNVEEFGIAAVEAQAAGRPVVAVDAGGVRETVLPDDTGVLVAGRPRSARARPARRPDALRGGHARFGRSNDDRRRARGLEHRVGEEKGRAAASGGGAPREVV